MRQTELIHNIIFDRHFTLSKLHKLMRILSPIILKEILNDKRYPSFSEFRSCLGIGNELFSIADGIILIHAWTNNKTVNLNGDILNAERIRKAEIQTARMISRDNAGLLGVTVSRQKAPDKKHPKKVQSVWTVKKK